MFRPIAKVGEWKQRIVSGQAQSWATGWGGNRTDKGGRVQAVLSSILATARQQGKNPLDVLIDLLVSPDKSKILDLVPSCRKQASPSSTRPQTPVSHTGRAAWQAEGGLADEGVMLAALPSCSVSVAVRA